jgi:hypothetical protein
VAGSSGPQIEDNPILNAFYRNAPLDALSCRKLRMSGFYSIVSGKVATKIWRGEEVFTTSALRSISTNPVMRKTLANRHP